MDDEAIHDRNSNIFYIAVAIGLVVCLSAIYVNLVLHENYTQFTDNETAPGALDFYVHS
jgi:hypothetical protein